MNAAATSPGDLLRAGACAWWLSCCSALRLPACSPGASLAFHSTRIGYLFHPVGAQRCRLGGLGDRTSHAPGPRGGSYIGSGTVTHHKKLLPEVREFCESSLFLALSVLGFHIINHNLARESSLLRRIFIKDTRPKTNTTRGGRKVRSVFCVMSSSIGIAPTLEPSQPCVIGSDHTLGRNRPIE